MEGKGVVVLGLFFKESLKDYDDGSSAIDDAMDNPGRQKRLAAVLAFSLKMYD